MKKLSKTPNDMYSEGCTVEFLKLNLDDFYTKYDDTHYVVSKNRHKQAEAACKKEHKLTRYELVIKVTYQ